MSHQLKLNAVHFSNSLEAEKALLESSQSTLESRSPSASLLCFSMTIIADHRQPHGNQVVQEGFGCRLPEKQGNDVYDTRHSHSRSDHLRLDIYAH